MSHINRKDRKRWDRIYKKYLEKLVEGLGRTKNLQYKPFLKNIEMLKKYGWQSSVLMSSADYEYRHTPPTCRRIFLRVNIINHLCNNIFFLHKMLLKKFGFETEIYTSQMDRLLFYALYLEIGKVKIISTGKGHCEAAAAAYADDAPCNTGNGVKEGSEKIKYMFAPVSEKAAKKFNDAKYWTIFNNPTILLHTINIKSRIFELRFNSEEEKEYWQSLPESDRRLASY